MNQLQKELDEMLKSEWDKLLKSMGATSMDELLKAGKKDKSKLVPVKKQITRGGKTVETTVWVSPKEAEEMKRKKKPEEQKKPRAKKKQDETKKPKGKSEVGIIAPHNSAELKELHKQLDSWKNKEISQALKEASKDHYLVTAKLGGKVVGVGSFQKKGNSLYMEHFGSTKEQKGVGKQLVQHLLEQASKQGVGVTIKPPKGSVNFLSKLGFKDDFSGVLSLDAEGVKKAIGDKSKEAKEKPAESASEKSEKKSKEKKEPTKKEEPKKEKPESKKPSASTTKEAEHKKLTKELRSTRKQLGSNQYRDMLEHHGISWEKTDHQGVNTMRATMAAAKFIKEGGKLDVDSYLNFLSNKDHVSNVNKEVESKSVDNPFTSDTFETSVDIDKSEKSGIVEVLGKEFEFENLKDDEIKIFNELSKVESRESFYKLYYKLEDEDRLTVNTNKVLSEISSLYQLKDTLFDVKGYNISLSSETSDKIGQDLNKSETLSSEEDDAIYRYTGQLSTTINSLLRGKPTTDERDVSEITKNLESAINKTTLTKDTVLFRGAGFDAIGGDMATDILDGNFDKYIGATITDKGFMSTSLGANSKFSGDVTFQIKAPSGTKGRYVENETATLGEHEVILQRGTTIKIQDIKLTNDDSKIQILAEVVNDGK